MLVLIRVKVVGDAGPTSGIFLQIFAGNLDAI